LGLLEDSDLDTSHRDSGVAGTVWPWRESKNQAGPKPLDRTTVVELLVPFCVGLFLMVVLKHRWFGLFLILLSCMLLLLGITRPSAIAVFKMWMRKVGQGVGFLLAWALLAPFFYIVFTFGRLMILISGKDPMHRKRESSRKSYWGKCAQNCSPESYRRQF
jgi:hypothetical protein